MSVADSNEDHDGGNDGEEAYEDEDEDVLGNDTAEGTVNLIFRLVVVKVFSVADQLDLPLQPLLLRHLHENLHLLLDLPCVPPPVSRPSCHAELEHHL